MPDDLSSNKMKSRDVTRVDGNNNQSKYDSPVVLRVSLMLILDDTTLFFYSLRLSATNNLKKVGLIRDWATEVTGPNAKTTSKAKSKAPSSVVSASTLTAVSTSATTKSRTTSSGGVGLSGASRPPSTVPEGFNEIGGLFDEDESAEREAAMSSPIKGNKRVTSAVM
jgi:hypothetical protein